MQRRHNLAWLAATVAMGAAAILCAGPAQAQNFPTRPLRLLVAQAPGSAGDQIARALATQLQLGLGQPVGVERVPEAQAIRTLIDNPSDAHILLLVTSATAARLPLRQPTPEALLRIATPIALLGDLPVFLAAGVAADVAADVAAGVATAPTAAPAAAGSNSLFAPVPRLAEAGAPGYAASIWHGLLAPINLHAGFRARLHAAVQHALAANDLKRRFDSAGGETAPGPPGAFLDWLATERQRYESMLRAAGAKPN